MKREVAQKTIATKVIVGIILFAFWWQDVEADAHLKARESSCYANLKQMGAALLSYRQKHDGSLPPNWTTLQSQPGRSDASLVCPLSGYRWVGREPQRRSYVCRFPERFQKTDAICWDGEPHSFPRHYLIPNRPLSRNVLFADGSVQKVNEDVFQSWGLRGTDIRLDRP